MKRLLIIGPERTGKTRISKILTPVGTVNIMLDGKEFNPLATFPFYMLTKDVNGTLIINDLSSDKLQNTMCLFFNDTLLVEKRTGSFELNLQQVIINVNGSLESKEFDFLQGASFTHRYQYLELFFTVG